MAKKAQTQAETELRKLAAELAVSFANSHPNHINNAHELINVAVELKDFLAGEDE